MPHSIIQLSNGIKLLHKEVNSPVSHFGVLVNAGTRDEPETHSGLAHLVEHNMFKGTTKRSGYQVISRIEEVGGEINASTSKEETYFHTSFLSPFYKRAIELFADIFLRATFPEKEMNKEKTVILEEINYYNDTPFELIFDDIESLIFGGHPLGRNILGNKKSVKAIQRADMVDFIKKNYTIPNIALASVGNISTAQLTKLCEHYFGSAAIDFKETQRQPFTGYMPQNMCVTKKTHQAHIAIANVAYSFMDDKKNPFMLITNLLGGQGMSSLLNMAIREKRGLAYSVEAGYSAFSDTGIFTVYMGCDNTQINQCIDLVYKEMNKLRHKKLNAMQLRHAKNQFLGQLAIANESKLNEMLALGRSALFFDDVETIDEVVNNINNLTAEELLETAYEILDQNQMTTLIYSDRKS